MEPLPSSNGTDLLDQTSLLPQLDSHNNGLFPGTDTTELALTPSDDVPSQEILPLSIDERLFSESIGSAQLVNEFSEVEFLDKSTLIGKASDGLTKDVLTGLTLEASTDELFDSRDSDTSRPQISVGLANDTTFDGGTNNDGITADPSIFGNVKRANNRKIKQLQISVDSRRSRDFVNVGYALDKNGNFSLDRADLEKINDAPLSDGKHTIYLKARDKRGRTSRVETVDFELNRVLYAISSEDSRELALVNTETDQIILKSLDDIDGWTETEEQIRSTEPRYFEGLLTTDQVFVPEGLPDPVADGLEAGGKVSLVLDPTGALFGKEGPAVKYEIELFGVDLGGTSTPETGDDVTAMHLHSGNVGEQAIGVHTLNIFGIPGEDDDDVVFDFEKNTISGIWDNSDSTDNVNTGNTSNGLPDHHLSDMLEGINPISTKTVTDFADELLADSFYLQVHTNDYQIPTGAIRAQISQVEGDGRYQASNEGFLEKAFIEHVLITPDEQSMYLTVNGSLQIANSVVALNVEDINWDKGTADLSVANTIIAAEAGEATKYPDGLAQVDDRQPIQTWPAQAWNQLHGPNVQPGAPIVSFSQWTNDRIFFVNDRTKELIGEPLVIDGVTNQTHGVTYNSSNTLALSPDYYWDGYNVDLFSVNPKNDQVEFRESITLDSKEGKGGFQHFVSWVDNRYAYVASMQYGPTSLAPEGVEVATPGFWLVDAAKRTAKRVIGTAETADDPGVFRNPSDFIVVGKKLYVAEEDSLDGTFGDDGYVAVYDISKVGKPKFLKRLKPGEDLPDDFRIAHGLSPSADGKSVYVASYRSNYLIKIDTETDTVAKVYGESDGLRGTHGGFAAGAYR